MPNGGAVAMIMFSTPNTTEIQLTEGSQGYAYPRGAPDERAVTIDHRSAVVSACVKGSFCLEVALPKVFVEMQSFGITEWRRSGYLDATRARYVSAIQRSPALAGEWWAP